MIAHPITRHQVLLLNVTFRSERFFPVPESKDEVLHRTNKSAQTVDYFAEYENSSHNAGIRKTWKTWNKRRHGDKSTT